MRFVVLWLRRGAGPWLFAPLAGFLVTTALMNRAWDLEFDWGARYLASSVLLFSPLVAAAAAYDVARKARPTLCEIALGAPRGSWALIAPALAVLGWALLGSAASWATVGVVVARDGGIDSADAWVFVETAAAFAAAALLGALIGSSLDGLLAVALAAGTVLICAVLCGGHHVSLFQVASSSGTMVGIERTPARAVLALACNLGVALASGALLASRAHATGRPRVWATTAGVLVVVVTGLSVWWPVPDSEYRPSTAREACLGGRVVVCGPAEAAALLSRAAADLDAARARLAPAGLDLPERFAIARGSRAKALPPGRSLLDYDTSALAARHLSNDTIASTFSRPRPCAAFFSDTESQSYLTLADTIRSWLLAALANAPVARAPAQVRDAYRTLTTCVEVR